MPYDQHDIVILRTEEGGRVYAIVEVRTSFAGVEYIAVKLDKGPFLNRYRLSEDHIAAKIGVLDPKALDSDSDLFKVSPPENWMAGRYYACDMAAHSPLEADRRRWARLAACQPGDTIYLRHVSRRNVRLLPHRFLEVLPAGQKYVFTAVNPNGTVYRFPLDAVHVTVDSPLKSEVPQ
jgi:hypothetical protein